MLKNKTWIKQRRAYFSHLLGSGRLCERAGSSGSLFGVSSATSAGAMANPLRHSISAAPGNELDIMDGFRPRSNSHASPLTSCSKGNASENETPFLAPPPQPPQQIAFGSESETMRQNEPTFEDFGNVAVSSIRLFYTFQITIPLFWRNEGVYPVLSHVRISTDVHYKGEAGHYWVLNGE